jgi:hypothetical protein
VAARADLDPARVLRESEIRFTRRSGPGGQNRNKVETAAILTHRPTGLTAEASERRSQSENRAVALSRLRMALALEIRQPWNPDDNPSPLWSTRCRAGRIAISPRHEDLPALVAEALDALSGCGDDLAAASLRLGTTASQLVKLFSIDPRALRLVNQRRRERGLPPLAPR